MHYSAPFGVIFDVDGVLVDSARAHFQSWQQLARECGREVTEEQFAVMGRYLHSLYRKGGERIISGEAGIEPIKFKGNTPCGYCRYRAVCRFDPVLPENSPRIPQKLDADQIWEKMQRAPEVKPGD